MDTATILAMAAMMAVAAALYSSVGHGGASAYLAIMALFVFPYHANFEGRTRDVFRNARLMSWRHALTSLLALAVILLAVAVTVFYPQATGYGMLWLLIGFAGIATVNGRLFALVFAKYIAAQKST